MSPAAMVVPRRRRDRYILRAVSFLEFVFGIVLVAAAGLLHLEAPSKATQILFWVTFGLIFVKFVVFVVRMERVQEFHRKNRLDSKVGSMLVFLWVGLSIVLYRVSATESERTLSYVVIGYVFFLVVFLKANLTKTYINVVIVLTLKDGKAMTAHNLLDETHEFFVLLAEDGANLLIPKSEVASAKVWLEERPMVVASVLAK